MKGNAQEEGKELKWQMISWMALIQDEKKSWGYRRMAEGVMTDLSKGRLALMMVYSQWYYYYAVYCTCYVT